jgi:hypothetical protein
LNICQESSSYIRISKEITGTLPEDLCTFMIISCLIHLRQMFYSKSKHTFYVQLFFFVFICVIDEITWKNMVEPDRPHMTIWCVCIACWITKATNTHSKYGILNTFPQQQWLHECTSVLRNMYIALLYIRPPVMYYDLVSSTEQCFYCYCS